MTASGAAVAIAGLLSVFTAAAPADVVVFDGDPLELPLRGLCVAWDESDDPTATSEAVPNDAGLQSDLETVSVSNLLTVWSGTVTPAEVRADVFALFDVFRNALKGDFSLGGAVSQARISAYEYAPSRQVEGFLGQIRFTVSVIAFTI